MSDTLTLKRVVDLVTQADIDSSVYTIIDSVTGAVKKYPIGSLICSIAPIFDATAAYAAGKYCNYNGQLYQFDEAHAAGSWTGSDATAVTLSELLEAIGTDVDDLKEALTDVSETLATKADKDGSYDDLTAGNAKQLESTQYVEDSEPYLLRTSGGSSDIGNREYVDAIVGGSVVWNQLVGNNLQPGRTTLNGLTFDVSSDGTVIVNGTATNDTIFNVGTFVTGRFGHKRYIHGAPSGGSSSTFWLKDGYGNVRDYGSGALDLVNNDRAMAQIGIASGYTATNLKFVPQLSDLTLMFGSAIADYIYSLEQANAGAGLAWFKKLFPNMDAEYSYLEDPSDETSWVTKKLRDYEAGFLFSVSGLASHDMVGFNQWDEEWEAGYIDPTTGNDSVSTVYIRSKNYIPVLPDTYYYFKRGDTPSTVVTIYYDADKNYISGGSVSWSYQERKTPANARYMRFTYVATTYNHDICINLSWSGTHNGEYQPYEKHSYPLDDSLTLRGIPKLDAENNLYYDGDRYLPDGTVARRHRQIVLDGTENWQSITPSGDTRVWFFAPVLDGVKIDTSKPIIMTSRYLGIAGVTQSSVLSTKLGDKIASIQVDGWTRIWITDSAYSTLDAFVASLVNNPLTVIYELATPTTETADPYQEVQICNDWGTEEYVLSDTAFPVPVGHETRYPANLRDKLQHLPDLADDDGYYAIKQVGTQMSLEPFRIPKAPTTPDGTYTLKATVSSGTVTYAWVDESQG